MHHMRRHQLVQMWQEATGWAWKAQGPPEWTPTPAIVQITIPFTTARKRDPHNYCGTVLKAIVDGLVKVRVWPDDTPSWVGHREPFLAKGGEVQVILWPMTMFAGPTS